MNSSFRARCSDQQLLLRHLVFTTKHSVRELNPICELQRLTSRLRAGESFPKQKSVLWESNPPSRIGSPEPLPLGQGHEICGSLKGEVWNEASYSTLLASPFKLREAPADGLEPSLVSLTGSRLTIGPHRILQSAQWESNPHFRHGKAAGYRYIMGAKMHHYQIVKDQ